MRNVTIARKFVSWEVRPLEHLRREPIYQLAMKVAKHKPLTREDKNQITHYVASGAKLAGYQFFFPNIKQFYVEYQYNRGDVERVEKVLGIDKTAIRTVYKTRGYITHIQERV